ncbi:hypothetical protein C8Q78DRAFT_2712 [Trametes maxima]|nr:hypothetical protein C8Q78DRAFT_2712 [Trametes maxima]
MTLSTDLGHMSSNGVAGGPAGTGRSVPRSCCRHTSTRDHLSFPSPEGTLDSNKTDFHNISFCPLMATQEGQTQQNGGMAPLGMYISANGLAEPLYILSHSMLLEETVALPNAQFPPNVYATATSHVATRQNINFNALGVDWQPTPAHDLVTPHSTFFPAQEGWSVPPIPSNAGPSVPTSVPATRPTQIPSQASSFTLTEAAPPTTAGGAPLAHIASPHVPGRHSNMDAGFPGASQSGNTARNPGVPRTQQQSTCENCYLDHKRCIGGIPCKRCTLTGMRDCVPHERRQRKVRGVVPVEETLAANTGAIAWQTRPGLSS